MPYIQEDVRQANNHLLSCLRSNDSAVRKEAADMVTDYLRIQNRENSFAESILPSTPVTAANLDRQVDTPDPVCIIDIEAASAGAHTIPFNTGPKTQMIEAGRFPVFFKRLESKRYQQDVARLMTWNMDIKGILKDFLLKDINDQQDYGLISAVERIVGAQPINTVNAELGACQWTTQGTLNRVSLMQALKGLPTTNRRLNASLGLINSVTILDIPKLTSNEVGDNMAEKMFLDGKAPSQLAGLSYVVTIKADLVHDHDMYLFAEPKYTGVNMVLEDIILSTDTINYMIEFFGYKMIGMAIRNIAAVCKVSFTDTPTDWRTGGLEGSVSNLPVVDSSTSAASTSAASTSAASTSEATTSAATGEG